MIRNKKTECGVKDGCNDRCHLWLFVANQLKLRSACYARWRAVKLKDVRSAPLTNSAISDVINDEHVTLVVASSRELTASNSRMQLSSSDDKFWKTALQQNAWSYIQCVKKLWISV